MITRKYAFFFVWIFWLFTLQAIQAQVKNIGKPFIKNYTISDYHAHDQNWCVVQDKRGVIYVGNSTGLLEFDGVRWRLIEVPNKSTVRSLVLGKDGVVYVGAQGFLGYIATDVMGNTYLASLMDRIPEAAKGFIDVWTMHQTNTEGIVCRTRKALLIIKNKQITAIKPQNASLGFGFAYLINGDLVVRQPSTGSFKLRNGKLQEVLPLKKELIWTSIPLANQKTLLLHRRKVQIFDGQNVLPVNEKLNQIWKSRNIYCAVRINKEYWAIGTDNKGIIIFNKNNQPVQHIHKGNGLQDNGVYALFVDHSGNLWAGLTKGIAYIEINSPFSVLDQTYALEGSTYYTCTTRTHLLVGTSTGLYFKRWKNYENPLKDSIQFKNFPDMTNQVWQLNTFRGELLATYNPGVLRLENKNNTFIKTDLPNIPTNTWTFTRLKKHPDLLITGSNNGMEILEWKNQQWVFKHAVKGFTDHCRYLQEEREGVFWMSSDQKGAYKITLNAELDSVVEVKHYDKSKGLPAHTYNRLFKINGKNLLATENGVYKYDTIQDRFVRDAKLNPVIGNQKSLLFMRSDDQQNIWYVGQHKDDKYLEVGMLKKQENGNYQRLLTPFRKLRGSFIEKIAPHLNPIDAQNILFATKEGIIHYNPSQPVAKVRFNALLREVVLTGTKDSVIFGGTFGNSQGQSFLQPNKNYQSPVLDYEHNSLRFTVGSTYYADNDKNEYRYWLEGFELGWSTWTTEPYKEYTNLKEKGYTLHIQTRNIYRTESPEMIYQFRIQPPWYRTLWAYVGYVILGLLLLILSIRLYTQRLQKQKVRLGTLVEERTVEIRNKNKEILSKNSELEQQKEEISIQAESLKKANKAIEHKNIALEQQTEEIQSQAEVLKSINTELIEKGQEIEESYYNIKLLSEIGQEITSKLSISDIVKTVYTNVSNLMKVDGFGIGLHDTEKQTITYENYIHHHQKMSEVILSTKEQNRFDVLCITQLKDVFINDIECDYQQYLDSLDSYHETDLLNALMCIPLVTDKTAIGLIIIQSNYKNVYTNNHLNLLRNLAIYVTIALQNTDSYSKIASQKTRIEKQNEEIKASIRYAQKIQATILPTQKSFEKIFTEHFVIYEPKDIVSGDFYWLSHVKKRIIVDNVPSFKIYTLLATVDCTGHGVPGAFMSMIGSRLLNEIVNEKKIFNPAKILTKLQEGILKGLHQKESENNDGMDICLCRIEYIEDSQEVEVVYANAKRPLYYTHQDKLHQIKKDRVFIGGWMPKHLTLNFQNHTIMLERGDILYLSSDGFVDTPNKLRKSFGTGRLIQFLEKIMHLPLEQQKETLLNAKKEFSQNTEPRDDVVIVGVKL